jgi:hypothetical protein
MESRCHRLQDDLCGSRGRGVHQADFAPFGSVRERVDAHEPNERPTVAVHETSRLPITDAVADFGISPDGGGTELVLHDSYTLNRLGRFAKSYTDKQMREGIGGLTKGLKQESERIAASA